MAPVAADRWGPHALRSNFREMDFRMNTLTLTQTPTLVSFNECQHPVSSAKGQQSPLCRDTEKPPFSVAHVSLHTLTTFFFHLSWIYWRDSCEENTGAIFIVCGGMQWQKDGQRSHCLPRQMLVCLSLAPTHIHTHTHTHTHTRDGRRSQPWQGKKDERKPQCAVFKGGSTWKATGLHS